MRKFPMKQYPGKGNSPQRRDYSERNTGALSKHANVDFHMRPALH